MSDDSAVLAYWGKTEPVDVGPIVDAAASTGKTAKMRIYGPIASIGAPYAVSAKEFGEALDALDEVETIEVHLHSPGGDAFDGTAIKNQLQQHAATVNIVVDGIAASAASMIAMAGDTVSLAPSAQMMVHDAAALVIGQPADLIRAAEMLEKISDSYADAYAAKAGGTREQWREAMQPETWYTAAEAVKAGLADRVLPKSKQPVEPKTMFDLSIFAHAGRSDETAPEPFIPSTHKPPADPPEHLHTKGADAMSDTTKTLRERLGLGDDADQATVDAKVLERLDAAEAAAAEQTDPPEITDEQAVAALAKTTGIEPDKVKAALDGAKAGKVTVSQTKLDELEAMAKDGAEARGKQREQERDETIAKAFSDGKISADRRDAWKTAWDKDPEGAKADLDSLPVRFPVSQLPGYAGGDDTSADEELFKTFFPAEQTQGA